MKTMTLFNGKIFCNVCGKRHKYKKRAKKPVYVCSKYDNYGAKSCIRNQVDEEDLIWFMQSRFLISREEVTRKLIDEYIQKIVVDDDKTEIIYKNGETSWVSSSGLNV